MRVREFLYEYLFLPLRDLLSGERVLKYFILLKQSSSWSADEIADFQNKKLRELVEFASKNVPYYREWFRTSGVCPSDIRTVADLNLLPVVSKELMREEGLDRFDSESFPLKKTACLSSSGSTGKPFPYKISKEAVSVNTASKLLTWYKAGYRFGDRYMKIANSPRHGKLKRLQDKVNNCIFVSFFSLDDECLKSILDTIEKERPLYIRSYPAPLYLLARYRNSHAGYGFSPKHIFTTGSTLTAAFREEIENAFGCDIIDSYSCEGTPNVYETVSHEGYLVCQEYGVLEVVDGQAISTDLWNYAHPFIRYNTHDLLVPSDIDGERQHITNIIGRQSDSFITANGTTFTVHDFSSYFIDENECIEAYQVVKCKNGEIILKLVANSAFSNEKKREIERYWSERLGRSVSVQEVPEIPLMKNNKWLTIVEEK